MNKLLIILMLTLCGCNYAYAQVQTTVDVLPTTGTPDSTAVLNNNLRLQQNAINSIGGYFSSNGYLTEANGGTNTNLSAVPNGSILIQDSGNVGIGTFSPGTSGQYLTSQGAGSVPTWTTPPSAPPPVLSNTLFQYQGLVDTKGTNSGEITTSSTITPTSITGNYRFLIANGGAQVKEWTSKFTKISGINTVTIWCRIWVGSSGSHNANLEVDIGGHNNNVSGTSAQTTPEWNSFTIDVSALTNGSTYDVTAYLYEITGGGFSYCSNIIGFGS